MARRDGAVIAVLAIIVVAGGLTLLSPSATPRPEPSAWAKSLEALAARSSNTVSLPTDPVTAAELRQLDPYTDQITELDLGGDQLDAVWEIIARCRHLEVLHWRSPIGDDQIATLRLLEELRVLDLPQADLTDRGLGSLAGHPKLQLLRLRSPRVTDNGLGVLRELPALRFVHLIAVPVSDAGLAVFRDLPKLESLYLDGDRATDEGLSALIEARPDLHFHRDQTHISSDPRGADGHHRDERASGK